MKSKKTILRFLFLVSILLSPSAQAQDKNAGRDDANRNIETGFKRLALEEQQSKLAFDNEMRQLQLEQKRTELKREPSGSFEAKNAKCGISGHSWKRGDCKPRCVILGSMFALLCAVVHLLAAFWVYGDILRRKTGSRIWVVLALLTGLLGTLVYAVIRAGDKPAA